MDTVGYLKYRDEFKNVCTQKSDKTAITYMREDGSVTKTTFAEILKAHANLDAIMQKAGVMPGDRVAIIAPHSPQSVLVALGLAYANITTVLIDASLPYSEINRLIEYSDVQSVFTTEKIYQNIYECVKNSVPIFEMCEKENEYRLLNKSVACTQKPKTVDPEKDVIAILFSSGTTAQMKGVKITYESVLKSSEVFIRNIQWKAKYNYLHVFPLNHIAGYATVQAFLACGSELGMIENMTATKLQEALLKYQPYGFGMVPKVFEMMEDKIRLNLKQKGIIVEKTVLFLMCVSSFFRKHFGIRIGRPLLDFVTKQIFGKNIITIGTGASLCRASTSKFFLDLGLYWTNNYASTETNVPALSTGNFDKYPVLTAGYVNRNPEIDIIINNPDANGVGEIYIKSELLMKGYFRDDELTNQSYDGEYFKTGDYGYIDKKGYLFVTGRVKETILLHTGKKVSPTDVENYYKSAVTDVAFACCGHKRKNTNYDEIHMFVQTLGKTKEEIDKAIQSLLALSQESTSSYHLYKIHRINSIPMTSVGKVKRFVLENYINDDSENSEEQKCKYQNISMEDGIINIIDKVLQNGVRISMSSNIHCELGLDSLKLLELDIQIQNAYGVTILDEWFNMTTVQDLVTFINQSKNSTNRKISIPNKTSDDMLLLKELISYIDKICDVEYIGLENIPNTPCIIAPNHSSHLDTMVIYKAVGLQFEDKLSKMCCLAAKELAEDAKIKEIFKAIGAIPVDRKQNSASVLKTLRTYVEEYEFSALVFPEGTRTRTGKMGTFHDGVSIVSVKSGVPIVPVGIKGAFEIWPPSVESPIISDRKKKVVVHFGKPIYPNNEDIKRLTEILTEEVKLLSE